MSGFNWRLHVFPTLPERRKKEGETAAFETFSTPDQLGVALAEEDGPLHDQAIAAMNTVHHVRLRYVDWLVSEDYLLSRSDDLLFIGMQESLSADFEILKALLRLPKEAQLPPPEHPKSHRGSASLRTSLSPRATDAIRSWYGEDYKLYEQCRRLRNRWVPTSEPR